MEFVAGLLLGSIFGVVADRLWQWVEQRPFFYLHHSYFENIKGERGLIYTVRNVGWSPIPPYRIAIYHPDRGRLYVFNSDIDGPLGPDELRRHECPITRHGQPNDLVRNWLFHAKDHRVDTVEYSGFEFWIEMANSNRVLFRSRSMGAALAEYMAKMCLKGDFPSLGWEHGRRMDSRQPFGIKFFLERRKQRLENAAFLKEVEKAPPAVPTSGAGEQPGSTPSSIA